MGMLTLLAACNGADPPGTRVSALDRDGDGSPASVDCDEADPTVHPGAGEVGGDGVDQDCDGADALPAATLSGSVANEGYGSRVLLLEGGDLFVGAPFSTTDGLSAGRVYDGTLVARAGEPGAFFGLGLAALGDGTVLAGAPGEGTVDAIGGARLVDSPGSGGVIAARGSAWAVSTATGSLDSAGVRTDWDQRPDALALDADGRVWAGFARGPVALRVGDTSVARGTTGDEAGFALLFADVDADGREDLVVGAPGAGKVYLLDPVRLPESLADVTPVGTGAGRFGASLAYGGGHLYVGAPMAGAEAEGAVYQVLSGQAEVVLACEEIGAQCGASLATWGVNVAVGAPGAAESPGEVRILLR